MLALAPVLQLGIHGYAAGRGSGCPWRIFVAGGADDLEWAKVLRSLPGSPSWVICDDDKGIKSAVRQVWPNAVIHTCEGHLKRLLLDGRAADGQDPYGDLARRISGALSNPAKRGRLHRRRECGRPHAHVRLARRQGRPDG